MYNLKWYFFICFSFTLLFLFILYYNHAILKIKLLLVFPIVGDRGPASLAKSYVKTFDIFKKNTIIKKYFEFTILNRVTFEFYINSINNSNSIIWFLYPDYFDKLNSSAYSTLFKNTIYGPAVSPIRWFLFPIKNTFEQNWSNNINKIFAYVVQSKRVKNHLINKSKKIKNIEKQYIVSHGCMLPNNSYPIIKWDSRNIDILIYAKFIDTNREKELNDLINILKVNYTFLLIRYGSHSKSSLLKGAMNCKVLIYYSFYDCWPSSLMEMLNTGIYPIVQQCEFIEKYGECISRFDTNISKLINAVHKAITYEFNSYDISMNYKNRNNCYNVLKKTLIEIYYRKSNVKLKRL